VVRDLVRVSLGKERFVTEVREFAVGEVVMTYSELLRQGDSLVVEQVKRVSFRV
jgi:hypothetical protein